MLYTPWRLLFLYTQPRKGILSSVIATDPSIYRDPIARKTAIDAVTDSPDGLFQVGQETSEE
jgi:hypothetical protein